MRISHATLFSLVASLAFLSCDGSGSSTSSTAKDRTDGMWDAVATYPILGRAGDALITRIPQGIHSWCGLRDSSGTLIRRLQRDTTPERTDTIRVRLDVNDRLLFASGDTDEGIEGLVNIWSEWTRRSGTPGALEGVWNYTFRDTVDVAYGNVPDSALARILEDRRNFGSQIKQAGAESQIEISTNTLVSRARFGEPATIEYLYWGRYFKGMYDLALERVDANTLRYTGKTETVTVTYEGRSARLYSSSDPSRKPYRAISEPTENADCPEDAWFDDFMGSHYRQDTQL